MTHNLGSGALRCCFTVSSVSLYLVQTYRKSSHLLSPYHPQFLKVIHTMARNCLQNSPPASSLICSHAPCGVGLRYWISCRRHILNTQNSLISLRRWDRIANGTTNIKNGILTLLTKDGMTVAKG